MWIFCFNFCEQHKPVYPLAFLLITIGTERGSIFPAGLENAVKPRYLTHPFFYFQDFVFWLSEGIYWWVAARHMCYSYSKGIRSKYHGVIVSIGPYLFLSSLICLVHPVWLNTLYIFLQMHVNILILPCIQWDEIWTEIGYSDMTSLNRFSQFLQTKEINWLSETFKNALKAAKKVYVTCFFFFYVFGCGLKQDGI